MIKNFFLLTTILLMVGCTQNTVTPKEAPPLPPLGYVTSGINYPYQPETNPDWVYTGVPDRHPGFPASRSAK